jgi:hypothetical protein
MLLDEEKQEVIQEREALVEMYKAGFLDGYKKRNKLRNSKDWALMNKFYKLSFLKRFEKGINKILKKK